MMDDLLFTIWKREWTLVLHSFINIYVWTYTFSTDTQDDVKVP